LTEFAVGLGACGRAPELSNELTWNLRRLDGHLDRSLQVLAQFLIVLDIRCRDLVGYLALWLGARCLLCLWFGRSSALVDIRCWDFIVYPALGLGARCCCRRRCCGRWRRCWWRRYLLFAWHRDAPGMFWIIELPPARNHLDVRIVPFEYTQAESMAVLMQPIECSAAIDIDGRAFAKDTAAFVA